MAKLTQQRLKELFYYDPESGAFERLVTAGGQVAGPVRRKPDALGYLCISVDCKSYKAHRLAWLYMCGQWPSKDIDHADGIRHNNRFSNLREATESQNLANSKRRCDNTSGYKGVRFYPPNGKWLARLSHQGTRIHLGYFETPELAYSKYLEAAHDKFGAFARAA